MIVGLNNETKSFMLGTIKDRVGTGHQYLIEWFDKSISKQNEEHLFGAFNRRDQHRENAYVLAMDDQDNIYKPAKTISISDDRKHLKVRFLNTGEHSSSRYEYFSIVQYLCRESCVFF